MILNITNELIKFKYIYIKLYYNLKTHNIKLNKEASPFVRELQLMKRRGQLRKVIGYLF